MADYKISLGVELDTSDIRTQINAVGENVKPIQIKVDTEAKELTKSINDALKTLSSGTKNALKIDTSEIKKSLDDLSSIVDKIKHSLSSIDNGDMKSIVSSINQMAKALGTAENESDSLVKSLTALSKKDLSINIGLDMGKKNNNMLAYGRVARKQVIPELEAQIKELETLLGGKQAAMTKLMSQSSKVEFDVFSDFTDFNSDSAIKKMEAMEKYVNSLKKLAAFDDIKLDGFNEVHKNATELINDITGVENAVDKAGDVPEKIKKFFGGGVDGEKLSAQLDSIVTDLTEIKTSLQGLSSSASLDGLTQSFNKLSETLDKVIANAGNFKNAMTGATSGTSGASGIAQDVEKVGAAANKAENEVNELKNALKGMGVNSDTATISQEIETLGIKVQKVTKILNDDNSFSIKVTGVKELNDGLEQSITLVQRFNSQGVAEGSTQTFTDNIKKANDEILKLKSSADELSTSGFVSGVEKQFNSVQSSLKNLTGDTHEVQAAFNSLESNYNGLMAAQQDYMSVMAQSDATDDQKIAAMHKLIEANELYQNSLKTTKNLIADNVKAEADAANAEILTNKKNALMSEMNTYLQQNTKAAAKYGDEIRNLQSALSGVANNNDYRVLTSQWDVLKKKIRETGDEGKTFGQTFKDAFASISQYLSAAALFNYAQQAFRSMFEQVKAIDTAMTELKKVTDETDAFYNRFLKNAASRAKEIGTTIDGLVTSTADFARLGYGFEDAQGLAEVANIYTVVGDEISGVEDATQSLISTMAAFKDEMGSLSDADFALSIVDKFNEVSNNFSISSGGIGEALTRSASSLAAANNTLDESIALITAAM